MGSWGSLPWMPSLPVSTELPCLCCQQPVLEQDARLYQKVFVCSSCQERGQNFEARIREDLHVLQRDIEALLRVGVRSGYFDALEQSAACTLAERMAALIRWSDT